MDVFIDIRKIHRHSGINFIYYYMDSGNNYTIYNYWAGTIREEWLWGECYSTKYYSLDITFDENGIVKSARIRENRENP